MSVIVLFVVLLISVSAYSERIYEAAEGYKAPDFTIENSDTSVSLADLKGRYVLVSFWSSSDAESRLATRDYDTFAKSMPEERFCLLSVNFDRSERLFREIVRRDNLSTETQYHVQGENASTIMEDYHLTQGFRSFLVDPQGRIIAGNPSSETLTRLVNI